jgi:hypothetical protein
MIFHLYLLASIAVLLLAIGPFLKDPSNPKRRLSSWAFLGLSMLFSPITLPNMVLKRVRRRSPAVPIGISPLG